MKSLPICLLERFLFPTGLCTGEAVVVANALLAQWKSPLRQTLFVNGRADCEIRQRCLITGLILLGVRTTILGVIYIQIRAIKVTAYSGIVLHRLSCV